MALFIDSIRKLSLRHKLLALVLIPLLLLTGTVIYLTAQWSTNYTYKQLFTKVNTDLRVTQNVFSRMQLDRQRALNSLAESSALLASLQQGDSAALLALLQQQKSDGVYDFINLLSADGSARLELDGWTDRSLKTSPLTDAIFSVNNGHGSVDAATGIEIYDRDQWLSEDSQLENKVVFPLIDTPRAAPTDKITEDRAMVIRVLHAVRNIEGDKLAVLEGGLLLNRNYAFVDEIRDLVYGPGSLAEGSRGTVTVFLDDVRITTNVPSSDDTRALGTRVSVEVRNTVLEQGTPWIDRAFVVNDWYISAYEPILDVFGQRVGMLYAGYLEAPFRSDLNRGIALTAAVVLAGSLLAVVVAILGAKTIFKPVESIASVVRATAAGERRRIGDLKAHDEIGELAKQFDFMLDTLEENSAQIKASADVLEQKVQERTVELESKNRSLQESIVLLHEAQEKLATAERLAAVGELTAGVAHEINNPTAVILGNMDILIDELGDQKNDVQTEIDLIIEQVYRIRSITDRLLQYSRPQTTAPLNSSERLSMLGQSSDSGRSDTSPVLRNWVNVNELIDSSLRLVSLELESKQIQLVKHVDDMPAILADEQELQQVVVNLILNAVHAVEQQGLIEILAEQSDVDTVNVRVKDNGIGIEPDNVKRLFDPFFTFGKEGGTGLGLSVSYGIVQRHNGAIEVQSTPGEGTEFIVKLPVSVNDHPTNTHNQDKQGCETQDDQVTVLTSRVEANV